MADKKVSGMASHTTTNGHKSFWATFGDQLSILLRKNTILQLRFLGSTVAQALLAPFVFSLLLLVLQQADRASQAVPDPIRHMPEVALPGVSRCQGSDAGRPCITMMYTVEPSPQSAGAAVPSTSAVNFTQIMDTFAILNERRTGYRLKFDAAPEPTKRPTGIKDIVFVPSSQFIYSHTLRFGNTTAWAITFTEPSAATPLNVQYQVWFNDANVGRGREMLGPEIVSVVRGIDEAIITVLNDPTAKATANIDVLTKEWPQLAPLQVNDRAYQQLGPVFFFCSEMIIFLNVLSMIVSEKQLKLRHAMELMGLIPSVYWISHFLSASVLVLINAVSMTCWGLVFKFPFMVNTDFAVCVLTFFLFGEAMIMLAFLMTTLLTRTLTAALFGILVFVIGIIFQSIALPDAQTGYAWWTNANVGLTYIFSILPFFHFGRMVLDISVVTSGRVDQFTGFRFGGGRFTWADLTRPIPDELVPRSGQETPISLPLPVQAWTSLLINMFVYAVLMWYLDNVIADEFGSKKKILFFLDRSYWGFEDDSTLVMDQQEWIDRNNVDIEFGPEAVEDDDVVAARQRAFDPAYTPAVKLVNLHKMYGRSTLFENGQVDTIAVRNSSYTIEEGKLFALLGQNGAGKSTTIAMLSGMTPSSAGDALIYNMSVKTQRQRIRKMMGICPQHDVLFEDLTAREHIQLYAGIKGIAHDQINALIEERLKIVRLHTVADVRVATYSGGMKRRLSLVISTIGDPKIIFMDEPQLAWTRQPPLRVEADVLGDNVCIMSNGRIRAFNNSIALKTKFGVGFRVSVMTDVSTVPKVMGMVESIIAGANSRTTLPLVEWLEEHEGGLVKSWGISQSTLEEVFLKLVREANAKFSRYDEEEYRERIKVYKRRKH
ncbi:hypothetical protein BC831DRAFT_512721 [Entophlyctis helioformis]|nr:hypothetical protein BC831DRAFT_512721 [Entophlyctis helioformis]